MTEREPMSNEQKLREAYVEGWLRGHSDGLSCGHPLHGACRCNKETASSDWDFSDARDIALASTEPEQPAVWDKVLKAGRESAEGRLPAILSPEQPASEGEEKPASGLATFAEARAQWEKENPLAEPSTTEGEPTAPGKKWTPTALEEWTPEQWADALDAARTDLMCAEDFEPSDVAHVMNICAQVLRRPREQGERIWIKPHELADLRDDANGCAIIGSRDEDDDDDEGGDLLPAILIIHPDPQEPAGGEDE